MMSSSHLKSTNKRNSLISQMERGQRRIKGQPEGRISDDDFNGSLVWVSTDIRLWASRERSVEAKRGRPGEGEGRK